MDLISCARKQAIQLWFASGKVRERWGEFQVGCWPWHLTDKYILKVLSI